MFQCFVSKTVRPGCVVLAITASLWCARAVRAQEPESDELRKVNQSVRALIRKVSPSVVQILVTGFGAVEQAQRGNTGVVIGRQKAIGSGFVIDANGYIITNAHVVKGAENTLAPYRDLQQGELVFAFGSPEGLGNSVTMGVVSATARQLDPDSPLVYVQTDAPINPGNSGGPLVNVNGEVVGVNTFILTQSGGNEGLGFAIPSTAISLAYAQLRKYGHIHRSQIGVSLQTITLTLAAALKLPRNSGVVISDVLPESPAEAAGLEIGDVLLSVDGRPASSLPFVSFQFLGRERGDKVHLEVERQQAQLSFDVPMVRREHEMDEVTALADPAKNLVRPLGIVGIEIDKKIAAMLPDLRAPYGIVVAARTADGGSEVPLETGDIIRALNGEPTKTLDQLRDVLAKLPPGASAALQIQRDERLLFVAFTTE